MSALTEKAPENGPSLDPESPQRLLRFRLRTLLLITTGLSLGLGWLAYVRDQNKRANEALAYLQTEKGLRGDSIPYGGMPRSLYRMLGEPFRLEWVEFKGPNDFSDDDLLLLKRFPSLPMLSLRNTAVSREGLRTLKELPGLTWLDLSGVPLDDEAAAWVREIPGLKGLDVRGAAITDAGLAELAKIRTLTILHVDSREVTDEGVLALSGHPSLRLLNLSGSNVTDRGLAAAATMPSLTTLYFRDTAVTNEGVRAASNAPSLRLIDYTGSKVDPGWDSVASRRIKYFDYSTLASNQPFYLKFAIHGIRDPL